MQVGLTWTANTPEVTETLMSASTPDADVNLKALGSLTDAFNAQDLDRIMSHFPSPSRARFKPLPLPRPPRYWSAIYRRVCGLGLRSCLDS